MKSKFKSLMTVMNIIIFFPFSNVVASADLFSTLPFDSINEIRKNLSKNDKVLFGTVCKKFGELSTKEKQKQGLNLKLFAEDLLDESGLLDERIETLLKYNELNLTVRDINEKVIEELMESLGILVNIKKLNLLGEISDVGLERALFNIKNLKELTVQSTGLFTGEGLQGLQGKELRLLAVDAPVTDELFQYISLLNVKEMVWLKSENITGQGFQNTLGHSWVILDTPNLTNDFLVSLHDYLETDPDTTVELKNSNSHITRDAFRAFDRKYEIPPLSGDVVANLM